MQFARRQHLRRWHRRPQLDESRLIESANHFHHRVCHAELLGTFQRPGELRLRGWCPAPGSHVEAGLRTGLDQAPALQNLIGLQHSACT
jgi:hypothetical protein